MARSPRYDGAGWVVTVAMLALVLPWWNSPYVPKSSAHPEPFPSRSIFPRGIPEDTSTLVSVRLAIPVRFQTSAKESRSVAKSSPQDKDVAMDRRTKSQRRSTEERRTKKSEVAEERREGERRQKVQRRRQIDPTTCERDYTNDEIEFMQAMDDYKRRSGRMFPTCSEILEVIRDIGYVKQHGPEPSEPT